MTRDLQQIELIPYREHVVTVAKTSDEVTARQCFDGTDSEWSALLAQADQVPLSALRMFYIVSASLQGGYMADSVALFVNWRDAIAHAHSIVNGWKDEDADALKEGEN